MLPNTLNTNEVRDASGTEVEFTRLEQVGRSVVFAKVGETPSLQHRLSIRHAETGAGIKLRRRSVVRVDIQSISGVDSVTPVTTSAYIVLDAPQGALDNWDVPKSALAQLTSFVASLGTSGVLLYDGTGNGAVALINGSL